MKNYLTYFGILLFAIFSIFYMNNIINLFLINNKVLDEIKVYKEENDYKCIEGYINEFGIVLGINGNIININKSYSNMKGIGFKEDLIIYDTDTCVTSAFYNTDRYIIGGNPSSNNISIVIDVDSGKYYKQMISVFNKYKVSFNLLVNRNTLDSDYDSLKNYDLLYKGNSEKDFKEFKKYNNEFLCVKYNNYDVLDICNYYHVNSVLMNNKIDKELLFIIKNNISKGDIIFISENVFNLNELSASIKYLKSRGIGIVSIKKLVF